jgi:hypothetical protein
MVFKNVIVFKQNVTLAETEVAEVEEIMAK